MFEPVRPARGRAHAASRERASGSPCRSISSSGWAGRSSCESTRGRRLDLHRAPAARPTRRTSSRSVAPARREAPALHGALRILHVEDNLANLALVEQILARHQEVELIAATLGGLALELARRHRPDVILLDLHLPDMSGIDVLGRLRADPVTTEIPVVVVSADATPDRIGAARRGPRGRLSDQADRRAGAAAGDRSRWPHAGTGR